MKYKATVITFEVDQQSLLPSKIDSRRLKFKAFLGVEFENYNTKLLKLSVLDRYVERVISSLKHNYNVAVLDHHPIFRARDYIFTSRKISYRISMDIQFLSTQLDSYLEQYDLDFDPPFQRGYVWTKKQKIAYVEYLLYQVRNLEEKYILTKTIGWGTIQQVDQWF